RQGLLRRDRRASRALEADSGPLQGLRRDAEVERLPVAAHDGDRAEGTAARDPGADPRDAPDGRIRRRRPLDLQAPRRGAAAGVAPAGGGGRQRAWLGRVVDAAGLADPAEFMDSLMGEMFDDEVFVFTPQGEVKALPSGATPLDFAYAVHTDVGHRCVGAKVNGRIVPLHSELGSGDIVEILTSNRERGPSRDWLTLVRTSRARNKIRQWFAHQQREDLEQKGRDSLAQAFRSNGLPSQKLSSAPLLAQLIREMGFKKADDFYVAIGGGKVPVSQVVNKVLQRLKTTEVAEEQSPATRRHTRARV